jgi:conjugal transfer/type IV secretion protein DotA/TraY
MFIRKLQEKRMKKTSGSLMQWFKALAITSLWFVCPEVLGAVFEVAPNDKSKEYLGIIFGGQIGSINLGGPPNPMLGKMFERFNFIIVTIGTLVISYIGILSVVNTAREGEAMGKKFSTWMILRVVFGLLFMIPTPGTGYSLIQVLVTWIVLNGIGAANSVWGVVVDQLKSNVPAVGGIEIDVSGVIDASLTALSQDVMRSSICMETLNSIPSFVGPNGPVKITIGRQVSANNIQSATMSVGTDRNKSICGIYTITSKLKNPQSLTIKINALNAIFDTVSPAARLFKENSCTLPDCPAPGYLVKARLAYKSQATALVGLEGSADNTNEVYNPYGAENDPAVAKAMAELMPKAESAQDYTDMKNVGWIHAGGYYNRLARVSTDTPAVTKQKEDARLLPTADANFIPRETTLQNGTPTVTNSGWSTPLINSLSTTPVQQAALLNKALGSASIYMQRDLEQPPLDFPGFGPANATGNAIIDALFVNPFNKIQDSIVKAFISTLTGGEDPLAGIGKFGSQLMLAGELLPIATMIIGFLIALAVSPGACVNPMAYAGPMLINHVVILIGGIASLLWACGAMLGVYLPMIPYIIFLTTAFGWMMAVIEAIVGAPILALGMMHPSAQEELGKIAQGLGILANIFLRPTLMIFGFIIAASLLRAGLAMLNFAFAKVLYMSVRPTILSIIAVLSLYTGLVIGMVNAAFSLIYELPNKILRYMGVAEERGHAGAEEISKGGKEQFGKGAAAGEQAAGKMHAAASKDNQERVKKGQEKAKDSAAKEGEVVGEAPPSGGAGGGGGGGGGGPPAPK